MSVDKFGHHSTSSKLKVIRGPPGEGFSLTEDGNYNIHNKRLCNVSDPKSPLDAVNKSHLDKRLIINSENSLSFNGYRLTETGQPINEQDAVNLKYMKENTLILDKDGFNANDNFIRGIKIPEEQSHVANKTYVDNKLPIFENGECDFQQTRLININDPINSNDCVNKRTMIKTMNEYKHDLESYCNDKIHYAKNKYGLDFKNLKLTNIGKPLNATDAVNKETLIHVMDTYKEDLENEFTRKIRYKKTEKGLDFNNERLINIGRPDNENDAVSVRYLIDILGSIDEKILSILYRIYIELTKDEQVKNIDEFKKMLISQDLFPLYEKWRYTTN